MTLEEFEERVRQGRISEDVLVQFEAVTGDASVRAGELDMYWALRQRAEYSRRFTIGAPPLLTALLVGVQLRIYWFSWVPGVGDYYVSQLTNWTPFVMEDGQLWRPLTAGLLHVDVFHIATNMLWLAFTGWNLERALGRANLALLYFASVLGGYLLSMVFTPESLSLGASGGVFGLVAASVAFGLFRPELLATRQRPLFGLAILPYLVLLFLSGLTNARVDNWAHFGGLLAGGLLAPLLDPVDFQRRSGWNRRVHGVVIAACAASLLGVAALGPRIEPILDSAAHRIRHSRDPSRIATPSFSAVTFDVPTGWRPGADALGASSYVSPVGDGALRAWRVSASSRNKVQHIEQVAQDFEERVRADWPDAQLSPLAPTTIAGAEGLQRSVRIGGVEPRVIEWRGAARGVHVLQEVWQVDQDRHAWLAPLRDRLRATVVWPEPRRLTEARIDYDRAPTSARFRTTYALALARYGQVAEALELHRALVTEKPEDPERWVAALEVLHTGTSEVSEPEVWWADALAAAPVPKVVEEVARGLEGADRIDDARGLLQLAWRRAPGDRVLRRARRRADLPTELDSQTGLPWESVHDPVTGRRIEAGSDAPTPSLRAAVREGQRMQAERDRIVGAIVAAVQGDDRRAGVPWFVLRRGRVPPAGDADAQQA
ncbi:MAG: rhomboid family intramembrane serine protease, partial [Myxococcales bacterium]|nr:rhomboid family intramembrane serine protease [Myxococcales bacterium]